MLQLTVFAFMIHGLTALRVFPLLLTGQVFLILSLKYFFLRLIQSYLGTTAIPTTPLPSLLLLCLLSCCISCVALIRSPMTCSLVSSSCIAIPFWTQKVRYLVQAFSSLVLVSNFYLIFSQLQCVWNAWPFPMWLFSVHSSSFFFISSFLHTSLKGIYFVCSLKTQSTVASKACRGLRKLVTFHLRDLLFFSLTNTVILLTFTERKELQDICWMAF